MCHASLIQGPLTEHNCFVRFLRIGPSVLRCVGLRRWHTTTLPQSRGYTRSYGFSVSWPWKPNFTINTNHLAEMACELYIDVRLLPVGHYPVIQLTIP